jgi:thiol-disulfide isomerase/thioredoxin
MHVDDGDDERVFDRDLWDKNSMVEKLTERATVEDLLVNNLQLEEPGKLMVIYGPWCKYCMAAEEVFEAFAESAPGVAVAV